MSKRYSAPDLGHAAQAGAILEALKTRVARVVQHHHFPVQDELVVRQGRERTGDLRERSREIVPVARDEERLVVLARGTQPVPVELELE